MVSEHLLVEPAGLGRVPAKDVLLGEPQGNLLLGALDAVGTVAHVAAGLEAEVAADGAGGGGEGVGGTEHDWRRVCQLVFFEKACLERGVRVRTAAGLDGIKTLPNHSDDGAAVHVYSRY